MSGIPTSEGGVSYARRKRGRINMQATFDVTRRCGGISMSQWVARPSSNVPRFRFYDDTRITLLLPVTPATDDSSSALSQDGTSSLTVAAYGVNTFDGIGGTVTYKTPVLAATFHHNRKFGKNTSSLVLKRDLLSLNVPTAIADVLPVTLKKNAESSNYQPPVVTPLTTSSPSSIFTSSLSTPSTSSTSSSALSTPPTRPLGAYVNNFSHLSASMSVTRAATSHLLTTVSLQASSADNRHHGQVQASIDDATLYAQYVNTTTPHRPLGLQCVLNPAPRDLEPPSADSQGFLATLWRRLPIVHFEGQAALSSTRHPLTGEKASSLFGERNPVNALVPTPTNTTTKSTEDAYNQNKPSSLSELPIASTSPVTSTQTAPTTSLGLPTQDKPWGTVGVNVATTGIAQVVGSVQLLSNLRATALLDTSIHMVVDGLSGVPSWSDSVKRIPFTFAWGIRYN